MIGDQLPTLDQSKTRYKKRAGWAVLLFALFSLIFAFTERAKPPLPTPSPEKAQREVVVTLFRGSAYCSLCDKMSSRTRLLLSTRYAKALGSGQLSWRQIDIEKPGNEHYVTDYGLYTTSIVLSLRQGNREIRWKNLDKAWKWVDFPEKFDRLLSTEIDSFLKEVNH